jgi:hypothetical protein
MFIEISMMKKWPNGQAKKWKFDQDVNMWQSQEYKD